MTGRSPAPEPPAMPRMLLWAVAACLFALALIAIIAVASLAGFSPENLISFVKEITKALTSLRG